MYYLPIIDYHITTGSYLAAKLYDSKQKIKYLISLFKARKNQLPFSAPASILSFQILFPNGRKSTTYRPYNKTRLPNTATISATKSKIF